MIYTWFRVIRIKFLLASVIAVLVGLVISWWQTNQFDVLHAALTLGGVLALHASVDLFNDYWDFKRGIDTQTKRTKFSGGTGVLPDGLLKPAQVYRAGILFLIIGAIIGSYFVYVHGIVIGIILAFAILSIYFYSTKIVDWGLAEIFVSIKGTMIVLGTYFIQTNDLSINPILGGIFVGVLSSLVLFITSLPDHDADKAKGRKTLVIVMGKKKSSLVFWVFPVISYGILILGIILEYFPVYCLISLVTIPLIVKAGRKLRQGYDDDRQINSIMSDTLSFSRITGGLFVIGFLFGL